MTPAEIELKLGDIETDLDELFSEIDENLPYWDAIEQALSAIQFAKKEVQKEMTKQQIDLLTEANELADRLLKKLLEASTIADELKCSFDHWIAAQTEVNRLNKILDKAVNRCKRRALSQ